MLARAQHRGMDVEVIKLRLVLSFRSQEYQVCRNAEKVQ